MIFCGVDNGADGAFVAIDQRRRVVFQSVAPVINVAVGKRHKRIPDASGIAALLQSTIDLAGSEEEVFLVLEKAQVFPKDGVVGAFYYGCGFGVWQGVLAFSRVPHAVIAPKEWQKHILAGVEGEDTKAQALLKVQRLMPSLQTLFPRCRNHHTGLPDAGCMALYALQLWRQGEG